MTDKINITCSSCGKTSEIPEYSMFGLPYEFYRCTCDSETKINPRRMNSRCWEWAWMELHRTMKEEFGDSVANRLVEYIIKKRNYYIKDREHPREDVFEPQSLQGSAKT